MDTKEKIRIMQAYLNGKIIQVYDETFSDWVDVINSEIEWNWHRNKYRIKPELKLRPYANAEEFLKAEKKHGPRIATSLGLICIAIIDDNGFLWKVTSKDKEPIYESFSELIKFKWQDGTSCGILEN